MDALISSSTADYTIAHTVILKWVSEQSAYSESTINLKQKQSN
ncbi:2828_t:CDS:2 [Diversispora eburnea]|uniref:2828_t:CDS:1 n=1 Tax=Diversispora eburnea TaxID=1213867 RepID=A0A9N9GSD6_9GLOM|nr:2828_t:CDS:2 [Diversispora eburnea]